MEKPVRVLLATNLDRGGGAILTARVARYLNPERVEPILYLPRRGFVAELAGEGVELLVDPDFVVPPNQRFFGWRRLWEVVETRAWAASCWWRAGRRLVKTLKERQVDVLFAFGVEPQFFCALMGMRTGLPVVWSAQQTYDHPLDPLVLQLLGFLPSVRSVVAVSEAAAAPYRVLGEKTRVFFNGVDPEEFDRERITPSLRQRLGVSAVVPLIGVVGRPSREKGFDIFVRAAPRVLERFPEARFVILGAGASQKHLGEKDQYLFEQELSQLIQDLGLSSRVFFTGAVEDVRPLMADLDIIALPSRRDAAPLVAFEGMALKIPVVGSRVHGIPEIIEDGVEGLLTSPGDEEALSRSMITLLANPQLRARMGEAGRARVCTQFDIRANMGLLGEHLRQVARGLV